MGSKKRSSGPAGGLAPDPGRQKARSHETLSRARKRAEGSPVEGPEISVSRVGLIEIQPLDLVVYWEAEYRAFSAARKRTGDPQASLVLRFREVSLASKEAGQESFDIRVEGLRGSRSVKLKKPTRLLRCELGVLGADGRFSSLARSNVATMPPERESERYEESYRRMGERMTQPAAVAGPPPNRKGDSAPRKLPPMQEDIQRTYREFPPRFPRSPPPSQIPPAPPPGRQSAKNSSAIKPPPPIVPAPPPKGSLAPGAASLASGEAPARVPRPGPPVVLAGPEASFELEWGFWQPEASEWQVPPEAGAHSGETPSGEIVTMEAGKGPGPEGSGGPSSAPTSFGGASAAPHRPGDELFLELYVDVVLYGRTKPGTKILLKDRELTAKDDGTFEIRFSVPPSQGPVPRGGPERSTDKDR